MCRGKGAEKKVVVNTERGWESTNNVQVEKAQVGRKYKSWMYLNV